MSWWTKLFGERDAQQKNGSESNTRPTGNPVTDYKRALA